MESYIRLKISAPGKVILHGEHSVVYGKPALVAAISARNNLLLTETNSNLIEFHFVSLNIPCKIPLNAINEILDKLSNANNTDNHKNYSEIYLEETERFIKNSTSYFLEFTDDQLKKTIIAVLFLLIGIFCENGKRSIRNGFHITLSSELDLGAGLGSSASFAVCFAAAFLCLVRFDELNKIKKLNSNWKEIICKWAFHSEKIMHGQPSGVDNTICTYGGLLKFKRGQPFTCIEIRTNINILLINSKIPRSTSKMVQKLFELHQVFPNVIENIFNAMELIVDEASELYKNFSVNNPSEFNKIKRLFQINNDLLRALGVSHEKLDLISLISSRNGFSSKITGAGGGGYMIILLANDYKNSKEFDLLCAELLREGFKWKEVEIGADGVTVEIL